MEEEEEEEEEEEGTSRSLSPDMPTLIKVKLSRWFLLGRNLASVLFLIPPLQRSWK